jgi:peptide/nickel transport system substrate-binding protein
MPAPGAGTCWIVGDLVSDCPPKSAHTFVPPPEVPGEYWQYYGQLPSARPTTWYESPQSYQLVKAGKLPPLDERVPPPEERGIIMGPTGIGVYGGTYRQTATASWLGEWIMGTWNIRDSDGVSWYPWIGKSFDISEDGRTYTFVMRENTHWSSGAPFTIEDIRFAWEDVHYNKELFPIVPTEYRDPITDNAAEFTVVDEKTWQLVYDTPVFNITELRSSARMWCAKGVVSWFCPSEYLKQFHPKFADPAALQAQIDEANLEDWTQLFSNKGNVFANPDLPVHTAWGTCVKEDRLVIACRNHYYTFFDVEGNQLPYADEAALFSMETREVAVFRAMNGELDGRSDFLILSEMPLYNANMEKGDYSLYHWPSTGGSDVAMFFNMTYNKDPEIGRILRTRDFRVALALAWDREVLNENILMGVGTIQNWAPHPSTPYYPGLEVAQRNIAYDPDRANTMLDLILPDKDAEGYRLRTDNGERLVLKGVTTKKENDIIPLMELIVPMFADVGIAFEYMLTDSANADYTAGDEYIKQGRDVSGYQANPWCCSWNNLVAMGGGNPTAPGAGLYIETSGERGTPPGVDTAYLPLAPADTYPFDPSGNLKKLQDLWQEGRSYPALHPRRVEIGKTIFDIYTDEMYSLPVAGFSGIFRGIYFKRNNFVNAPRTHVRDANGYSAWVYYFEDGQDNWHFPANKAECCKSESFLGGG